MRNPKFLVWSVCLLLAGTMLGGCQQSRDAVRQAQIVADETRRTIRIPDHSTPKTARAIMGRAPDAVQHEGGNEIHYYFIKGALKGETLRLVYRNGQLIGRSIVYLKSEE